VSLRTRLLIPLVAVCIIDAAIPIPILGVLLISILFQRPRWFIETVHRIYGGPNAG